MSTARRERSTDTLTSVVLETNTQLLRLATSIPTTLTEKALTGDVPGYFRTQKLLGMAYLSTLNSGSDRYKTVLQRYLAGAVQPWSAAR